jgi:putative FmdB family regulatory protein
MPIFEVECDDCGQMSEVLVFGQKWPLPCPNCGSTNTRKLISATSSLSGHSTQSMPGPGDSTCCGGSPGQAGCNGPGSCCGKA